MKAIIRTSVGALLFLSLVANWWLMGELNDAHIRPRKGKDCSVEMKSFLDGSWGPVILVHGYADNYSVAKYIVDVAEKEEAAKGGREKGSFRVKVH